MAVVFVAIFVCWVPCVRECLPNKTFTALQLRYFNVVLFIILCEEKKQKTEHNSSTEHISKHFTRIVMSLHDLVSLRLSNDTTVRITVVSLTIGEDKSIQWNVGRIHAHSICRTTLHLCTCGTLHQSSSPLLRLLLSHLCCTRSH